MTPPSLAALMRLASTDGVWRVTPAAHWARAALWIDAVLDGEHELSEDERDAWIDLYGDVREFLGMSLTIEQLEVIGGG